MIIAPSIRRKNRESAGSMVMLLLVLVTTSIAVAGVISLVSQQSRLTHRRSDAISAMQFAEGGAVIACNDLNTAVTLASNSFSYNMTHGTYAYAQTTGTSNQIIFQRTIASPFTNQTIQAQISITNPTAPQTATITTTATVGSVTQTAIVHCKMSWGYPAAIISVHPGAWGNTSVSKTAAQAGDVVINGDKSGPIVVDGNVAKAVLANGRVNVDTNYLKPLASVYAQSNYATGNQIPDYTAQGTSNTLFDISRFIAVADKTPGGPSPSGNNHFTNVASFEKAASNSTSANPIEGVVVVDVSQTDGNNGKLFPLSPSIAPHGVNIKGTLVFNFIGSGWDPTTEKIIVTADMNVNAANLTGLVATNPATYPSGYPPVYSNSAKNPTNIDISSKGFPNFGPDDDLPAMIYTIGVLDLHGNANISGVMYTPSYMEIENKSDGQTQYMKGALIMGNGIYYENTQSSTSIISFDSRTLDSLSTVGTSGKQVTVAYWE